MTVTRCAADSRRADPPRRSRADEGDTCHRWASWKDGHELLLKHGLAELARLRGTGPVMRLQLILFEDDGTQRTLADHPIHTERADGGVLMARSLLSRALLRLEAPFEGTVEMRWERGQQHRSAEVSVDVGTDPFRALDVWRTQARHSAKENARKEAAMLQMFDGASDVIRAAGGVGKALAGQQPEPAVETPTNTLLDLLWQAREAGLVDEVFRMFGGGDRPPAQPSPPSSDGEGGPEPSVDERFDAWGMAGIDVSWDWDP